MSKTSVVICTYHRSFEGDGNKTILNFQSQNLPNFSVLFDNQQNLSKEEVSKKYNNSEICLYNDDDFTKYRFNKPIDRHHYWGSHQNPKYFYAHFRMLVYFLKNPNYDYYWFFDDDVIFDGNLNSFIHGYSNIDDDFMAIQIFKKENYIEFPNVSVINSRMSGSRGHWLGLCPGPGDKFKNTEKHMGSFFPIVRFSKKALQYLFNLHLQGYYGYSEGFVPTSIASNKMKVSSMMDEYNKFIVENNSCELYHKGQKFTWEWL